MLINSRSYEVLFDSQLTIMAITPYGILRLIFQNWIKVE